MPKSSSNTLATYRLFSSEAMVSNWNGLTSFPIPMARTSTPLSRRLWAARERFSSDISGEGCGVCVPSVSTKAIWKQERQRLRKQGLPGVDFEVMIDVDFQGKLQCSEIPKFSTAIHAKTDLLPSFNYQCHTAKVGYLTVILRGRAGYELIYITNEAVGRVGYYQLISGKSEKNNCFSKFSSNSLDFLGWNLLKSFSLPKTPRKNFFRPPKFQHKKFANSFSLFGQT